MKKNNNIPELIFCKENNVKIINYRYLIYNFKMENKTPNCQIMLNKTISPLRRDVFSIFIL
jgi:hypothetical protein